MPKGMVASKEPQSAMAGLSDTTKLPEPQVIGLLSRTISHSPSVRWILPARIRHQYQVDVVFVGENFIQLRELLPNGQLADVTARTDLGAPILAASVISSNRAPVSFVDTVIKQEKDEDTLMSNNSSETSSATQLLPPQLVVITTASSEVIFLYAKNIAPGNVKFVYGKKIMITDVSIPEKYGKHLAVDPESRAIAVAPAYGFCGLFMLKPADQILTEIPQWSPLRPDSFVPTIEDRFIQIDGLILKMDFLFPPRNAPHTVILLLLVAQGQETVILLYSWDTRSGLRSARPIRCSGQRLPVEDSIPLMLIPSSGLTSFIIVTETGLVVYDNILSPQAKRIQLSLPADQRSKYEKSSRTPLWAHWAKPPRLQYYKETHDDVCLVREDGDLLYCEINHPSPNRVDARFRLGNLGINVDSAFAILQGPQGQGGDIFVVGGDMTDGGVFHCRARDTPVCTQKIPNLAPVLDMLTINSHDHGGSRALRHPEKRERIFVCSGLGSRHAGVTEIRYGLEAPIGLTADLNDSSGVRGFWILPDNVNGRLVLLSSYPFFSSALFLHLSLFELEFASDESCLGLDLSIPTIAAGTTRTSLAAIQITSSSVNVTTFSTDSQPVSKPHLLSPVLIAAIDEESQCFVTGMRSAEGFHLQLGAVVLQERTLKVEDIGEVFSMTQEPISLHFTHLGSQHLLLVGTGDGLLQILAVDLNNGFHLVSEHKIADLCLDIETSAIGSFAVLSRQNCTESLLLCGLRNGILVYIHMRLETISPTVKLDFIGSGHYKFGQTTVNVIEDSTDSTAALILCDSELRRVNLSESSNNFALSVFIIWLTNGEDISYQQPALNAALRIRDFPQLDTSEMTGSLVCMSNDQILFSSLIPQPQAVLRRIKTIGNPKKLVYSKYLNKIVVALDHISFVEQTKGRAQITKRCVRPSLQLVDPDQKISALRHGNTDGLVPFGEAGESVTCILNWTPTDGVKHFEMIVIGTEVDAREAVKSSSGRLIYVSAKQREHGLETKVKTVCKYPGQPIRSMCPFGLSSLLVCAGNDLILQSLDIATRKWTIKSKVVLPSAAQFLSTRGLFVYAATLYHSVSILKVDGEVLLYHASDLKGRNITCILPLDKGSMITTSSDQGSNIVGFLELSGKHQIQVAFDVGLPLTVNCLQEIHTTSETPIRRQQFFGSTVNGTMYHFTTLTLDEWRLLHFIEMLTKESRRTSRYNGRRRRTSPVNQRELLIAEASNMHVRGDLLLDMVAAGPVKLGAYLTRRPDPKNAYDNFASAEERLASFSLLAEAVVGKQRDAVATVSEWMGKLLAFPL